ncbi:MAG: cytochrome b N-terminal domain-containing protein [Myxococcales bacterium]|nr:cytochrome b N-terminal domain-containing protein [Myxococcales bacterium]
MTPRKILDFLEDRTGLGASFRKLFDEPVIGGPRWAYVFGSALATLFLVQCVTGLLLMFTYAPTVDGAWSSVFYLQHRVTAGWFIRGLHAYGANAMVVILGIHMFQVVLFGAYKRPREVTFWIGMGLMALLLGLIISGYRLPWDQRTFWALQVEMNIARAMPGGESIYRLVAGGPELGQLTLTRLYTAHVALLPALFVGLILLKVSLVRRHGRTPPPGADLSVKVNAFPWQFVRDQAFVILVLLAVALLTVATGGEGLAAPADPNRFFPARPEWFLLPLYKLRMLVPPAAEILVTGVLPVLLGGFLFLLPLLDRKESAGWGARLAWAAPVVVLGIGTVALAAKSMDDDHKDKEHVQHLADAEHRADRAIELAKMGIPPEGPLVMLERDPLTRGRDVYRQLCTGCHVLHGEGERKSPDHDGFASRSWILGLLRDPQSEHYFGELEHDEEMPSQKKLGEESLVAVTEFLFAQGREPQDPPVDRALVEAGEEVFEKKCLKCHMFEGEGDFLGTEGPNLTDWASRTWIMRQVRDPSDPRQYGGLHQMPSFRDQLSEHDMWMVAAYLRLQRFE